MPKMLSKWKMHKLKWKDCKLCDLCETRKKIVLGKGSIPADVLFVGEAPGKSENMLGTPFIGPAGHELDRRIHIAFTESLLKKPPRLFFTNLVACIPLDPESGDKIAAPHKSHIKACKNRLKQCIDIVRPKKIVALGNLSEKWLNDLLSIEPDVSIFHPSYILRADIGQKGLLQQRMEVAFRDLFDDLAEGK